MVALMPLQSASLVKSYSSEAARTAASAQQQMLHLLH
jgi:hypothetical protein